MAAIDITQPELSRLLALDAADKAKRAKISAKAVVREARKRERRANAPLEREKLVAEINAFLDKNHAETMAKIERGDFNPKGPEREPPPMRVEYDGWRSGQGYRLFRDGSREPYATVRWERAWPRTFWLLSLGALLGVAGCIGGQVAGWW